MPSSCLPPALTSLNTKHLAHTCNHTLYHPTLRACYRQGGDVDSCLPRLGRTSGNHLLPGTTRCLPAATLIAPTRLTAAFPPSTTRAGASLHLPCCLPRLRAPAHALFPGWRDWRPSVKPGHGNFPPRGQATSLQDFFLPSLLHTLPLPAASGSVCWMFHSYGRLGSMPTILAPLSRSQRLHLPYHLCTAHAHPLRRHALPFYHTHHRAAPAAHPLHYARFLPLCTLPSRHLRGHVTCHTFCAPATRTARTLCCPAPAFARWQTCNNRSRAALARHGSRAETRVRRTLLRMGSILTPRLWRSTPPPPRHYSSITYQRLPASIATV